MDDLIVNIERAFIRKLLSLIQDRTITRADASLICRHYLAMFPYHDVEDIHTKIADFIKVNTLFPELALEIKKWDDDTSTRNVVDKMREHMQAGNIDKALEVAESKT